MKTDTELPMHPLQHFIIRLHNKQWHMDEIEEKRVFLFTKRGRQILIDLHEFSLSYDRDTLQ